MNSWTKLHNWTKTLWCCSSKESGGCFLEGQFESMSAIPVEPFVFHIPAAGVVFGYSKGSCFEDWYETSEAAQEAFEKCREQLALECQERAEPD